MSYFVFRVKANALTLDCIINFRDVFALQSVGSMSVHNHYHFIVITQPKAVGAEIMISIITKVNINGLSYRVIRSMMRKRLWHFNEVWPKWREWWSYTKDREYFVVCSWSSKICIALSGFSMKKVYLKWLFNRYALLCSHSTYHYQLNIFEWKPFLPCSYG